MTDGGDGLAGILHRPQEGLHLGHHAHAVGVHGAAGKMQCIELLRADVPDRAIDVDLHGLIEIVTNSLDLAGLEGQDSHLGASLSKRLHGLRQLRFLEAVGGKNSHTHVS